MSAPTFARWGTPPQPVELSDRARGFLAGQVGPAERTTAIPRLTDVALPEPGLAENDLHQLRRILGEGAVALSGPERLLHAAGCSLTDYLQLRAGEPASIPDAVLRPSSHEEISELLSYCSDHGIPVVPFGGGTSVVGGVTAGGSAGRAWVSVALDRMDHVLAIDEVSQTVTVEPGITGPVLEDILARRGFTLGHLPQSWERASIGGYVATRSAGQSSTGYGRSDDMVEALQVATPVGDIELGRGPKSAAGPDLRQLFIGSEGILGIITRVTLRVRRTPAARRYEGLMFPDWESGVAAFRELAQTRTTADVMRLSDTDETAATLTMSGPAGRAGNAFERYLGLRGVQGGALAVLGWESSSRRFLAERRRAAWKVLRAHGAVTLGQPVGRSWLRHRFDGPYLRDELLDHGYMVETVETAAHWRDLPGLYGAVAGALRSTLGSDGGGVYVMCHLSHIYETGASLYFTAFAQAGSDPVGRWRDAKSAATDAMAAHSGTITHHHAVGRDHARWLPAEIGDTGMRILHAMKAELDPQRIMNPGVLLPVEPPR